MKIKNILHITNNYPTLKHPIFGVFVKEQIKSLDNIKLNNEIFFINGIEKGKLEYVFSFFKLFIKLCFSRYDIIHCHHAFSALVFIITFRFINSNCIVSYQNPPEKEGGYLLFKILHHCFDKIIFKCSVKNIVSEKVIVLPNGVNTSFFNEIDIIESKKKLNLDLNKKYVLFMDSNSKKRTQKRFDRFSEVITKLKKIDSNIEPLIATSVIRDLIPYYMNASSLHLISSDFEGSPNSVKECLSCNTPVVTTPVGDVRFLLDNVSSCYVSDNFEVDDLVSLCIKSINSDYCNGRKKIFNSKLTIDDIALKLSDLYSEIKV